MSKILSATCQNGVVRVGQTPVEAIVYSEGVGESQGSLLLEGEEAHYLTSNASDIKTLLEKVASALTKTTETLTAIGAGMTGPTTAPPVDLATNVTFINNLVTELTTLKDALK